MKKHRLGMLLFLAGLISTEYTLAQAPITPPVIPLDRPGDKRFEVPEEKPPQPTPELGLPDKPPPIFEHPELSRRMTVHVKKILFSGNTVFSDATLSAIARPYENRRINSGELETLRLALTQYYVDRGYINSGAIISDQKVTDGVIAILIVEGSLSEILISGQDRLQPRYIRDRIALGAGPPLNVNDIYERLLILQQDPRIRRINAALKPGLKRGDSLLDVKVEEERPYRLVLEANNHRPPSVGAEQAVVNLRHLNLTGRGDAINLIYGLTEGLDDGEIAYLFPLNARDTNVNFHYQRSGLTVIEEPFDAIDIESESHTAGIGIAHPLRKTSQEEIILAFDLEWRRSETFLLDQPFSFSPGVRDGVSKVTVLRFTQSWLKHNRTEIISARSTFSQGIDAFNATINSDAPDGRFTAWLGQFQWVKRYLNHPGQTIFRADTQLVNDPLLPLEQFAIGGASTVRGYRENQIVRDNGVIASFEYRYTILGGQSGKNRVQLAPFIDYGRGWNKERPTAHPDSISSIGLGLRWLISPKALFEVYWGEPLRDVNNPDNDLQDDGIHLRFRFEAF